MIENRPWLTWFSHIVMILGVIVMGFPVWMTFVASTHDQATMLQPPVPLLPGSHMVENYLTVLTQGYGQIGRTPVSMILLNSLIMALGVAIGKIIISILAAF